MRREESTFHFQSARRCDCRLITTSYFANTPASNIVRGPAADIRTRQNRRTRSAVELLILSNRAEDSSVARAPPADEESDRIDPAVGQSSPIPLQRRRIPPSSFCVKIVSTAVTLNSPRTARQATVLQKPRVRPYGIH
jgi:hypothetical protein